jgi:hypothetical protein
LKASCNDSNTSKPTTAIGLKEIIVGYMPFGIFDEEYIIDTYSREPHHLHFLLLSSNWAHIFEDTLITYVKSQHYKPQNNHRSIMGSSFLSVAMAKSCRRLAECIIQRGSYCPNAINQFGETTLMIACNKKYTDLALKILDHECNATAVSKEGETALQLAINNKMSEVVSKIVRLHMSKALFTQRYNGKYLFEILLDMGLYLLAEEYIKSKEYTSDALNCPVSISIIKNQERLALLAIDKKHNINPAAFDLACTFRMYSAAHKLLQNNMGDYNKFITLLMTNKDCDFSKYADVLIKDTFTDNDKYVTWLLYSLLKSHQDDLIHKLLNSLVASYQELKISRAHYTVIAETALAVVVQMNNEKYLHKLLETFSYEQQAIMSVYKRVQKNLRVIIMQYFDLSDKGFLAEKYKATITAY